MSERPITMSELRACGMCSRGTKTWFEAHGLDFKAFLRDGIAAEELLATGDGLGIRAVVLVRSKRSV